MGTPVWAWRRPGRSRSARQMLITAFIGTEYTGFSLRVNETSSLPASNSVLPLVFSELPVPIHASPFDV